MKVLTAVAAFTVTVGVPATAFGQVPDRFLGSWVVDAEATAKTIADDPDMAPENKPGWTERWLASGAEVEITRGSITFSGLEGGTIDLPVALDEDLADRAVLSAVIPGRSRQDEMTASIELRLDEGGDLNLRIRPENDFDLVVWQRSDDTSTESEVRAPGDLIGYLDSLRTCDPGLFLRTRRYRRTLTLGKIGNVVISV